MFQMTPQRLELSSGETAEITLEGVCDTYVSSFHFVMLNFIIVSHVAFYQVSISGLCDGTCQLVCLSVDLSVHKAYCGKTTEWIWMPFGMMSGVGQVMGVLNGVIIEGEG